MTRSAASAVLVGVLLLSAGCASVGPAHGGSGQRLDPWENWNRKVFSFNESLDENVLKPVATAYSNVVPEPVRRGVDNVFGNFADAWSAVNNFLQGKVENGLRDVMRVGTNTFFGLGGVIDIASEMGLDHQYEDFGQTLGTWGFASGPYVVWPLLGSSTVRDSFGLPLDNAASPASVVNDGGSRYGITTLRVINTRAKLLGASRVLDDIALDKYTFVRDAYLQRRRSLVFDGDAPPQDAPEPEPAASAPPAQ